MVASVRPRIRSPATSHTACSSCPHRRRRAAAVRTDRPGGGQSCPRSGRAALAAPRHLSARERSAVWRCGTASRGAADSHEQDGRVVVEVRFARLSRTASSISRMRPRPYLPGQDCARLACASRGRAAAARPRRSGRSRRRVCPDRRGRRRGRCGRRRGSSAPRVAGIEAERLRELRARPRRAAPRGRGRPPGCCGRRQRGVDPHRLREVPDGLAVLPSPASATAELFWASR